MVVKLPQLGFTYSANQLFWLAALPSLWELPYASFTALWFLSLVGVVDRFIDSLVIATLLVDGRGLAKPQYFLPGDAGISYCVALVAATLHQAWLTLVSFIPRRKKARRWD